MHKRLILLITILKKYLFSLLYNKSSKKNRHNKIFLFYFLCLAISFFGNSNTAKGDVWNYEEKFFKIYISHFSQYTDRFLNEQGDVITNPNKAGGFLQNTFINIGYNPSLQTELSTFITLEKNKDAIGRNIPSDFGSSFTLNTVSSIIWEFNYGLVAQDETARISLFYRQPVLNFLQSDHVLGARFSFPLKDLFLSGNTLISSTAWAFYSRFSGNNFFTGWEALQKVEMYQEIFDNVIQLNGFVEGVYSTWYYLKAGIGFYYPFSQYNKVGLHYINTSIGKWVLPSHGVLFAIEYYFNPF